MSYKCFFFVCVCLVPPDATVTGYDQSWSVNRKGAELKCEGVGNPPPHNFTWTRYILPSLPLILPVCDCMRVFACIALRKKKPVFPAVMFVCLWLSLFHFQQHFSYVKSPCLHLPLLITILSSPFITMRSVC